MSMEQSEYLKNLLKRLEEASEPYHEPHEAINPHSLSTIKFEKEDIESNQNYSKRDHIHNLITNNDTRTYAAKQEREAHGLGFDGFTDIIANSKTSRNSPALKFNLKVRKRSEDKFDRQLPSKRSGSTKREKGDLVEVRDRLFDIISFLNAKIDGNPEAQIKKVVDMDYVKESLLPKHSPRQESNNNNLLYLPKFQLHDAKLVKSSEILNNLSQENSKVDNQFLNLKHSFDKLNDIQSSHSLHHEKSYPHSHFHRQPISQQQPHQRYQEYQRPLPHSQPKPTIYINGRLNNSNSSSSISFAPAVKQIRPLSEVPVLRYVQYSQFDPNSPQHSNTLAKIALPYSHSPSNTYLPISTGNKQVHPPALNLGRPPTFRTITSKPLSTRTPMPPQPARFTSPNQPRPIFIQPQQINAQKSPQDVQMQTIKQKEQGVQTTSRLKKKSSSNQQFKPYTDETPKKLLTQENQDNRQSFAKKAEQELQKIAPPRPYTKFSTTTENPFKASETILSLSKKSSRFRADIANDILKSIAEQSQQNQPSKNLQASGRSSGRMMSSVHEMTPAADFPKLNKFAGSGSTKLKRKGIDITSSKKGYQSQYVRE